MSYDEPASLYSLRFLWPNLQRYSSWLWKTESYRIRRWRLPRIAKVGIRRRHISGCAHMTSLGYKPYILLDDWEEPIFKTRFGRSALARLDWWPTAEFATQIRVRIYDPAAANLDRHVGDSGPGLQLDDVALRVRHVTPRNVATHRGRQRDDVANSSASRGEHFRTRLGH